MIRDGSMKRIKGWRRLKVNNIYIKFKSERKRFLNCFDFIEPKKSAPLKAAWSTTCKEKGSLCLKYRFLFDVALSSFSLSSPIKLNCDECSGSFKYIARLNSYFRWRWLKAKCLASFHNILNTRAKVKIPPDLKQSPNPLWGYNFLLSSVKRTTKPQNKWET